jgi:hypothetical protein
VPWLLRVAAGLSPSRSGFDPRICGGQSGTGTAYQLCVFRISIIPIRAMQYLDQRVGLALLCSKPPWRRHPGPGTCVSHVLVTNCVLLRALVGCCINLTSCLLHTETTQLNCIVLNNHVSDRLGWAGGPQCSPTPQSAANRFSNTPSNFVRYPNCIVYKHHNASDISFISFFRMNSK